MIRTENVYMSLCDISPPRYPHYSQDTRTAQYLSLYVDDQRLGLWDGVWNMGLILQFFNGKKKNQCFHPSTLPGFLKHP